MDQNQIETLQTELNRQSRELKTIRELLATIANHLINAELEVPERMRRFASYMHDVHDIKYMFEESGHDAPSYILREIERLDDRYRQLLKELHLDGGTFEKVRREMAADPENRYDHTRLLFKQEKVNEAGQHTNGSGGTQEGADSP